MNNQKKIADIANRPFFKLKLTLITTLLIVNLLVISLGLAVWETLIVTIPFAILFDVALVNLYSKYKANQRTLVYNLSAVLNDADRKSLYNFPIPILCVSKSGTIVWYNDAFKDNVANNSEIFGENFSIISKEQPADFCNRTGIEVSFMNRYYHVKGAYYEKEEIYVLYFEDNTSLIDIASEHELSKPYVLIIMIDNYDDIFSDKKESVKSALLGRIDDVLEAFVGQTTGFLNRLSQDRFIFVLEKRHLDEMINKRFSILDDIREIGRDEKVPLTVSIGVGSSSETLAESETFAKQSLDMALGRGGDQAAVKTTRGFDFYGGVSKGIEKKTRVKSRVIATALRELIDQSDKVIVMGHKFGDLDAVGSAIGIARAIRKLDKDSFIAINYGKTLAVDLLDRLKEAGFDDMIVYPEEAMGMITKKTLLVIVDTHNPDFLESKELYDKCETVAVIDHHRKMINYVNRAVVFYNEPYASSTSELVAELIQYLGECRLGAMEAEAMLAGIMLDTKNFVIKAGVRTFEAAAYLKSLGADSVSVRKLFSSTIDSYQRKSRIVSGAETYRSCAVAIGDFQSDDMRVIAAQAADELLGISGVEASFVIYTAGDSINISARSMGDINVQVIMESLGGGGHHAQAACQIKDINIEKARQLLLEAIDKFLDDKE